MNEETISGIIAITILETYALSQGINGVLLTTVIGIIAGLAGYNVQLVQTKRRLKR